MKNTALFFIGRGVVIAAGLIILFFAGAWVGYTHPAINWQLATLGSIAITAIGALIWFCGRFSRSLPKGEQEESNEEES